MISDPERSACGPPGSHFSEPESSLPGADDLGWGPKRRLRVALVTSSYNYIKDGIALTLNRLVRYLETHDVDVVVVAPVGPVAVIDHAGDLIPVPSLPLLGRPEYRLALGLPLSVREKLKAFQPDIIHIAVPDILGYQALRFALELNVPVVASYHTRYETYLKYYPGLWVFRGVVRKYLRFFYRSCRQLYVPSESMAEALADEGIADNVRVWNRGVDPARFHPGKRSAAWRKNRGIGEDELLIIFVSRLVREKELGTLVGILDEATRRGIAYRGLIVGDGPERKILERQLPDCIFTGFLDGEELAQAYASSDLFLFPSDTESFGNVTLEAMASGLPAICADATGSRSLVVSGVTGFLAQPRNVNEFVEHIASLAGDDRLRIRMAGLSRDRSLQFSWEGTMQKLLANYLSVVEAPTS